MRLALFLGLLHGGGAQRVACLLADDLAAAGHEVRLFHHDFEPSPPPFPLSEAVDLRRLPLNRPVGGKLAAMWRLVRDARELRRNLKEYAPDVVVSFLVQANVLTVLASLGLGLPVVLTELCHPAHDSIGRGFGTLRRWAYPRADQVVVQTRDMERWFAERIPCRLRVIPNPVPRPKDLTARKGAGGRWRILAAARLTYQKNLDLLVRAFARVAAKHPDWDLVIYGQGEDWPLLEGLVAEKGLADRVSLPGWTSEFTQRLAESDIFVLSSRYEGLPMALAEAMALGLACVSTDCPSGPADLIQAGVDGLLVPNEDEEALAEALDRLMSEPELRALLGAKAREVAQRFSRERVLAMWESCLDEALATKRGN